MKIWLKNTNNVENKAYKLVIKEKKVEKKFASLKKRFNDEIWARMLKFLTTSPQKGEKKMQFQCYDLPDGNRILYFVLEDAEIAITRIVYAGNHNDYMTYLRKFGKKKK